MNFETIAEYAYGGVSLRSGARAIHDHHGANYLFYPNHSVVIFINGRIDDVRFGTWHKLKEAYLIEWEEPEYYE